MPTRFRLNFEPILDSHIHPLAFGTVTFYQSGTEIPTTIYSDAAGSTPKLNPVTLDADGKHSDIWLSSSVAARAIVRDAQGAVIPGGDIDPVTTAISAADIPFTQSGSGAVERSLQDKLGETLSATDFGAKGDGTTDDTFALQKWLDAIAQGCTGYLPAAAPGAYYLCTASLTHTGYLTIRGDGLASRIHYTGNGVALTLTGPRFSRLENFYVTGTSAGVGGMYIKSAQEGYYDNGVRVEGFTSGYGRRFSSCWSGMLVGGSSKGNLNGVVCDTTVTAVAGLINNFAFIGHSFAGNTGIGLDFQSGFGLSVTNGCDFSTTGTGIEIARGVTYPDQVRNFSIIGNYFESTNCIYVGRGASSAGCAVYGTIAGNHLDGVTNCIHLFKCSGVSVAPQTMGVGVNTIDAGVDGTTWNSENAVTDNSPPGNTSRVNSVASQSFVSFRSVITIPTTVAGLPGAGVKGRRAFVTDATSSAFNSAPGGGGTTSVPVWDDGSIWRIG